MEGSFFLGFSQEGKQVYSVQAGKASALREGAPVITHNSSLTSEFTLDSRSVVPVTQLPASTILSTKFIKRITVNDGDDALKGTFEDGHIFKYRTFL